MANVQGDSDILSSKNRMDSLIIVDDDCAPYPISVLCFWSLAITYVLESRMPFHNSQVHSTIETSILNI